MSPQTGRSRSLLARAGRALAAAAVIVAFGAAAAQAASPPFPSPAANQLVYDPDRVLSSDTRRTVETVADAVVSAKGLAPIVVVRRATPGVTADQTAADLESLIDQWQARRSVVLLVDVPPDGCGGQIAVRRARDVDEQRIPDSVLENAAAAGRQFLGMCNADSAVLTALTRLTGPLLGTLPAPTAVASTGLPVATTSGRPSPAPRPVPSFVPEIMPAGPPYPDPTPGRYVYDTAGVFRQDTIDKVQAQIQAIRDRTGAEIVVYTQVAGPVVTEAGAEADARALMDQWGVGRRGFDDGLVILYDLDTSREHGQVQLYAGPGYAATFLSNQERQAIFDNEMLPLLKQGDLDGALLVAMERIDANATPAHAETLSRARQINAVVGLVGAPVALILLVAWPLLRWLRYGRDPEYLDDPSILMPAPPPDLTAAAGALVFDGRSSRHTLTTAMLDLASRDELAFQPEVHKLARDKLAIEVRDPDLTDARIRLNRRRPISPAETYARGQLAGLAVPDENGAALVGSKELLGFGPKVSGFDDRLEQYVTQKGWFSGPPRKAMTRWYAQATIEIILGVILVFAVGLNLPSDGLVLLGAAIIAAGVITLPIARAMPARTMAGAMIRAMLAAYRRTLDRTFAMARSMDEVVASGALPWLETPDQAVVWGVALGLRDDVEAVLERTASDISAGRADPRVSYMPAWYGSGWGSGGGGGGGGVAPGLFSGSAVPNFGGMMAAIGTIGNSASSGGGGFGGGGSGGGGGGAGGGF